MIFHDTLYGLQSRIFEKMWLSKVKVRTRKKRVRKKVINNLEKYLTGVNLKMYRVYKDSIKNSVMYTMEYPKEDLEYFQKRLYKAMSIPEEMLT